MADKLSQKLLSIYISILVLLKLRYNHLNCRKPSMEIVACRISILEDKEEGVSTHWTVDNISILYISSVSSPGVFTYCFFEQSQELVCISDFGFLETSFVIKTAI